MACQKLASWLKFTNEIIRMQNQLDDVIVGFFTYNTFGLHQHQNPSEESTTKAINFKN